MSVNWIYRILERYLASKFKLLLSHYCLVKKLQFLPISLKIRNLNEPVRSGLLSSSS